MARAGGTIADTDTDAEGRTRWTLPLRAGGFRLVPCGVVINGATPRGMPTINLADIPVLARSIGARCP